MTEPNAVQPRSDPDTPTTGKFKRSLRVNRSGVAENEKSPHGIGLMVTNLKLNAPDALLKIVEQFKEYYVEPLPRRHCGRPRTFSA